MPRPSSEAVKDGALEYLRGFTPPSPIPVVALFSTDARPEPDQPFNLARALLDVVPADTSITQHEAPLELGEKGDLTREQLEVKREAKQWMNFLALFFIEHGFLHPSRGPNILSLLYWARFIAGKAATSFRLPSDFFALLETLPPKVRANTHGELFWNESLPKIVAEENKWTLSGPLPRRTKGAPQYYDMASTKVNNTKTVIDEIVQAIDSAWKNRGRFGVRRSRPRNVLVFLQLVNSNFEQWRDVGIFVDEVDETCHFLDPYHGMYTRPFDELGAVLNDVYERAVVRKGVPDDQMLWFKSYNEWSVYIYTDNDKSNDSGGDSDIMKDFNECDTPGAIEAFAQKWCGRVYDVYSSDSEVLPAKDLGTVRDALPPMCNNLLSQEIKDVVNENKMAQNWGEVSVRLIAAHQTLNDVNILAKFLVEDRDRRTQGQKVQQPMLLDCLLPEFELWGLFLAKGIDPKERQWARNVARNWKTEAALSNSQWQSVQWAIDHKAVERPRGNALAAPKLQFASYALKLPLAELAPSNDGTTLPQLAGDEEEPLPLWAGDEEEEPEFAQPSDNSTGGPSEAITSTERHTLESFFANAPNAPPIRKEAMEFGVGLAAAQTLEDKGIRTASKLSDDDVNKLAREHEGDTRIITNKAKAMKSNTIHREEQELAREREEAAQLRNARLIEEERGRVRQSRQEADELLAKVDVSDTLDGAEERQRSRVEAAKARVAAREGWEGQVTSSESLLATAQAQTGILAGVSSSFNPYDTDEKLVAACSGGAALYGINLFPNVEELSRVPLAPVLKTPEHVDLRGPNVPFEARVMKTTSNEVVASFHNSTKSSGMTAAESAHTSVGGSASVSGWGNKVSASHSQTNSSNSQTSSTTEATSTTSDQAKTTTATIVEYIICPMKSFRIPVVDMRLSDEVIEIASKVRSLRDARSFLDLFGSHVSSGTHLMGGVFFHTTTTTTTKEVHTSSLMRATAEASKESKGKSSATEASVAGSYYGVTASASASFSQASSSGGADFHDAADNGANQTTKTQAMYTSYVRSLGPNAATAEAFATALFSDNSSWAIIDRGPLSALVSIDELLRRDLHEYNVPVDQQCINLIQAARQSRARNWAHLLYEAETVPLAVREVINRNAPRRVNNDLQESVLQLVTLGDLPLDQVDSVEELSAIAYAAAEVLMEAARVQQQPMPDGTLSDFLDVVKDQFAASDGQVVGAVVLLAQKEATAGSYAVVRGKYENGKEWARFEESLNLAGQELVFKQLEPQARVRVLSRDKAGLKVVYDALQMAKWNPKPAGWAQLEEDGPDLSFANLEGTAPLTEEGRIATIEVRNGQPSTDAETGFAPVLPIFDAGIFSALTTLSLSHIGMGGTLEKSGILSKLKSLTSVDLSSNNLTGGVPSLKELPRLKTLNLSENLLDGSIHPDVWTHKLLEDVNLSRNHLGGEVMQNANMPSVVRIDLSYNFKDWPWDENYTPPTLDELTSLDARAYGEANQKRTPRSPTFLFVGNFSFNWVCKSDPLGPHGNCPNLRTLDVRYCGWCDLLITRTFNVTVVTHREYVRYGFGGAMRYRRYLEGVQSSRNLLMREELKLVVNSHLPFGCSSEVAPSWAKAVYNG